MPSTYQGKFVPIVSSTDATPIVVRANGHGYATNDIVLITLHLGNTNANGQHVVTVVDADHFLLNGSVATGNGAGGASGVVTSFVPLITLPSDGDGPIKVADVNPGFEGEADRLMMLYREAQERSQGIFRVPPGMNVISRMQAGFPCFDPAEWAIYQESWGAVGVTGVFMTIPLDLPHGSKWTSYDVFIHPAVHAAVPASPPIVAPFRIDLSVAGAASTPTGFGANVTDPAANIVQYNPFHGFGDSSGAEIVDRTRYRYVLRLVSEHGANSVANMLYCGAQTTCQMPNLDLGAS